MAKNGILNYLKGVYYDLIDDRGELRTNTKGTLVKDTLPYDRLRFLQDFIYYLANSDFLPLEAKTYIKNRYISIKGVNEELNDKYGSLGMDKVNFNTTSSRIGYAKTRLVKIFGEDVIYNVLFTDKPIDDYVAALNNLKHGGTSKSIRDNLIIDLPDNAMCSELSDEAFEQFVSDIAPYFKASIKGLVESLDIKAIGYFNYILSGNKLSPIDRDRINMLEHICSYGLSIDTK